MYLTTEQKEGKRGGKENEHYEISVIQKRKSVAEQHGSCVQTAGAELGKL